MHLLQTQPLRLFAAAHVLRRLLFKPSLVQLRILLCAEGSVQSGCAGGAPARARGEAQMPAVPNRTVAVARPLSFASPVSRVDSISSASPPSPFKQLRIQPTLNGLLNCMQNDRLTPRPPAQLDRERERERKRLPIG
ncbi:hypothetical protein PaG_01131 [Moesziomyces aphidis]|uniref:Uncharacterized protein n=1 Tax=Moesziomyces aphidis TaxID=84754 RepID=W3VU40_MOEAP|nr:hypothetical protein PaG_01131 [Moesziomyces aphidis]